MKTPVIIDALRTPIGRAHAERGYFREVRGDDLASACVRGLLDRNAFDPAIIDDVLIGCTQQTMEHGFNVGRFIGLLAGVPFTAGGATINRLCGSSLQTINQAAHAIVAGAEDVQIVGGVEHMHHLPMGHALDINPRIYRTTSPGAMNMGLTAEFLAQSQQIKREEQDAFAFRSHQRAAKAQADGQFKREILPTVGRNETGERELLTRDQCVRADTSLTSLAKLVPVFLPKFGTLTAGNSSPLNDGAAALLMMSAERAKELGLKPLVKVRATAVTGVQPCVMGTGPVPASQKALNRAGLQLSDIGLIEINEAFAVQTLTCIRQLGLDEERVNVRGGALAIGHPLGASGARIATTLIHAMVDQQVELGLATMCIGAGQGIATIFELI